MQVQKITNHNTNFGYNPKLNAQLVKKLTSSKENRIICDNLLKLNNFTNETETALRAAESTGNQDLILGLGNLFVNLKAYLSDEVEFFFPKLKYCEKEAKGYIKEAAKRKNDDPEHWLNDVVMRLHDVEDYNNDVAAKGEEMLPEDTTKERTIKKESQEFLEEIEKIVVKYKPKGTVLKGFSALGGVKELKELLNDTVVSFLKDPAMRKLDAEEYDLHLPNGFLLYGPPGCGKTAIVEHLSAETGLQLFKINAGTYGSTYQHGGSVNLRRAFDYLESIATEDKPVILLIDEADAMLAQRDMNTHNHENQEMSILLERIQNSADNNIMVFLATNKFNKVDDAVKSRIEEIAFVGLPDFESRLSILEVLLSRQQKRAKNILEDDEAKQKIAQMFGGFSIRDIKMIIKQIDRMARKQNRRDITLQDFETKIKENEFRKVNEDLYKDFNQRARAGF